MEERGNQTEMPRAVLPHQVSSGSVIWGIGLVLAAVFATGEIFIILAATPAAIAFHAEVAGAAPWFVRLADTLGWAGLVALYTVVDAAILVLFAWLSRRHWIGFIFVAPIIYMGAGAISLWLLLADAVGWVLKR